MLGLERTMAMRYGQQQRWGRERCHGRACHGVYFRARLDVGLSGVSALTKSSHMHAGSHHTRSRLLKRSLPWVPMPGPCMP
jgi:hypothetical protein